MPPRRCWGASLPDDSAGRVHHPLPRHGIELRAGSQPFFAVIQQLAERYPGGPSHPRQCFSVSLAHASPGVLGAADEFSQALCHGEHPVARRFINIEAVLMHGSVLSHQHGAGGFGLINGQAYRDLAGWRCFAGFSGDLEGLNGKAGFRGADETGQSRV